MQVFGTALLIGILFAITDERNNSIIGGLDAFIIGLLVFVIGICKINNPGSFQYQPLLSLKIVSKITPVYKL